MRSLAFVLVLAACGGASPDVPPQSPVAEALKERRECRDLCAKTWRALEDGCENPGLTKEEDFDKCHDENKANFKDCTTTGEASCQSFYLVAIGKDGPGPDPGPVPDPDSPEPRPKRSTRGHASVAPDGITFITKTGMRLSCSVETDGLGIQRGTPVPVRMDRNLPFTGTTVIQHGTASIGFRPDIDVFSGDVQHFLFEHECGHVNSGVYDNRKEIEANCWGAGHTRLSEGGWEDVRQALARNYPFAKGLYPDGATQWQGILSCRSSP